MEYGVYGDLAIIYPKPYSIYLGGTTIVLARSCTPWMQHRDVDAKATRGSCLDVCKGRWPAFRALIRPVNTKQLQVQACFGLCDPTGVDSVLFPVTSHIQRPYTVPYVLLLP